MRRATGADHRIGGEFWFAGAGFGGSCFPKDLRALLYAGREHGTELIAAVNQINEQQKQLLGRAERTAPGRAAR